MTPGQTNPPSAAQVLARLLGSDEAGKPPSRLGAIIIAVIAATIVVVAVVVWPLARLKTHPLSSVPEAKPQEPLAEQFVTAIDADLEQIEGRSLFAKPPPAAPKKEIVKSRQPAPTRYSGPAVVAMVNSQVWFTDGQHLGAGESGKGGLKVVSLDAPWSAKVEWEGAPFTVDFFSRSPLLAKGGGSGTGGAKPSAEPDPTPTPRPLPGSTPAAIPGAAPTPEAPPTPPAGSDPAPSSSPPPEPAPETTPAPSPPNEPESPRP